MPSVKLITWLSSHGLASHKCAAVIRHQILTDIRVVLRDASQFPSISLRGIGCLTGSRVAGALARIPIESMFLEYQNSWLPCGFEAKLVGAAWVDIIFWGR